MDNLNELFALPVGLEPIPIFGSLKLYTSESLKKSYINAISKVDSAKGIIGKITNLVQSGLIIPCFLTKGLISTILFKMFPNDRARSEEQFFKEEMRNVFGFYESGSKKIYILINGQINSFGFANNDKMSSITIHEASHMSATNKPTQFMSTFKDILFQYYNTYFSYIFSLNKSANKEIFNIIDLLFKFEKSKGIGKNGLEEYKNRLMVLKDYSNADDDEFDGLVYDLILTVKVFLDSTSIFIKNIYKFRHILDALRTSYDVVFGAIEPGNLSVQELIFPSEVIAIGSEIDTRNNIINKVFKLL